MNKDKLITKKGKLFDQSGLQLSEQVIVETYGEALLINGSLIHPDEYVLTKNKLSNLACGWTITW